MPIYVDNTDVVKIYNSMFCTLDDPSLAYSDRLEEKMVEYLQKRTEV